MATSTYTLLDSVTLGSSAASVTFSSIDQSYGDLVLVVTEKPASGTTNYVLRFNGDTGANYKAVLAYGNGSTTSSFTESSNLGLMAFGGDASMLTLVTAQIMDYSATDKHTSVLSRGDRANQVASMGAGRWENTAAVTSVTVATTTANNYGVGSTFHLYGIAKAL